MNQRCLPMLAARAEPFDSPEYLFEVKWNGIRALAARHTDSWDLWGRECADYRPRYPEMDVLAALPPGTILDGELVRLPQGIPDPEAILARHQLSHPARIQHASRHQPVTYMVFDLLAHQGLSLVGQPQERRAWLQALGQSHDAFGQLHIVSRKPKKSRVIFAIFVTFLIISPFKQLRFDTAPAKQEPAPCAG